MRDFNDIISRHKYNMYDPFVVGGIEFCVLKQNCDAEALQKYLGKNQSFVAGLIVCMADAGIISFDEKRGYVLSTKSVGEALKMFYEYCGEYGGDQDEDCDLSIDSPVVRRAVEIALEKGKYGTGLIQTYLGLGNAYVAKMTKWLEEKGVIAPSSGNRPRDLLIKTMAEAEELLRADEKE